MRTSIDGSMSAGRCGAVLHYIELPCWGRDILDHVYVAARVSHVLDVCGASLGPAAQHSADMP